MSKLQKLGFGKLFKVMKKLENYDDRGKAIVGSSLLENFLSELLLTNLKNSQISEKLVNNSTLNRKIDLAMSLGVITEREFYDLNLIKIVRNKFAHEMLITFDDPEVQDFCKELTLYRKNCNSIKFSELFVSTCIFLAFAFVFRGKIIEHKPIDEDTYDKLQSSNIYLSSLVNALDNDFLKNIF
jgi:hypothetical protein